MKKKMWFFLVLALSLSLSGIVFAETEKEKAASEFQQLKKEFEIEASYSNNAFINRDWDLESGRQIVAMGKRALPFIMEEIKNGAYLYAGAASRITGIKMRGPTGDDLIQQWSAWWEENKDNPEWNVFKE